MRKNHFIAGVDLQKPRSVAKSQTDFENQDRRIHAADTVIAGAT
jgi:hypothetical protein